jgi:hypothetical protein
MQRHRAVMAREHRGRGRDVIGVDWTLVPHDRGPHIYGVKKASDDVARRTRLFQTVLPAVVAHRELVDGVAVAVEAPDFAEAEKAYVLLTQRESSTAMEAVRTRVLALLASRRNGLTYRKRTTIAVESVREIEEAGHCPAAQYAFDTGVLTREWTQVIEQAGKHGVSESECARYIKLGRARAARR